MSNYRYSIPGAHNGISAVSNLNFQFPVPEDPVNPENGQAGNVEAKLLYITTSRFGSDWNSLTHSHAFSELFFVTSGSGFLHYNGRTASLRPNDLVIINPYVDHAEFSQNEDPLEYIVLGIDGLKFSIPNGESSPVIYRLANAAAIGSYIRQLLSEAQEQALGFQSVCQHLLDIILTLILRKQDMNLSITSSAYVQPFCVLVKEYMDTHFKETLDLDTLSSIAKQNKFYLAHAFSEAYGISPMRYLMKRRIDESMQLLVDTTMPIYDISEVVGFSSPSHFAQSFKRVTGCSPHAYRKSHRK